jgi:hypothetical protein
MIRLWIGAVAVVVLAGCGWHDFRSEEYQRYYAQPASVSEHSSLERKKIVYWAKDPKQKERIGFLERYEVTLAGSREPKEYWIILDSRGIEKLGYINDIGEFFRYQANGTMTKIGEWQVIDLGVKIFFGLPIEHNIMFEIFDPYRD